MEVTGKITAVLPMREGVNQAGQAWKTQDYVIECVENNIVRHIVFTVRDGLNGRIARLNIRLGAQMTIWFSIDAREYQGGKWFNTIVAYEAREVVETI